MSARPRTEWSSPQIVLAIVLAILTAQSAYERFNGNTQSEIAVLKEQVFHLRNDLRELRQELRSELRERGRQDGGTR